MDHAFSGENTSLGEGMARSSQFWFVFGNCVAQVDQTVQVVYLAATTSCGARVRPRVHEDMDGACSQLYMARSVGRERAELVGVLEGQK